MTTELAVLATLALAVLGLAWWVIRLGNELRGGKERPRTLELLQREVQAVRAGIDERLREGAQQAQELSLRIGQLQKATQNVEQLGVGLNELQKILGPPQLRGGFGERQLEELLADTLPRSGFAVQYTYPSSGTRVDAVVFVGEGRSLPIDSKFPLDNFRRWVELRGAGDPAAESARRAFARDVMRHVDDIAERYLVPADGAVDIALMYIPSESVFHEISVAGFASNGCTLAEYAQRARVVPVSPNTLYAYLTVVRMGLKGFQLQESAREILGHLTQLQDDVAVLHSELATAIKQARHSLGNLEEAEAALARIGGRLDVVVEMRDDEKETPPLRR